MSVPGSSIAFWLLAPQGAVRLTPGRDLVIGRGSHVEVRIDDPAVSREHCRLRWDRERMWLAEDLASANGTIIAGQRITGAWLLADGQDLVIGGRTLTFRILPAGVLPPVLPGADERQTQEVSSQRGFSGVCKDLHGLVRALALAGQNGHLVLAGSLTHCVWFIDGVPRAARCDGELGMPALFALLRRQFKDFTFAPAGEPPANARIEGDGETILFALYGGDLIASDELARAEDLQRRLLGRLPEVPGWDLGVFFQGIGRVSGDFYDAGLLADGRLMLAIGDVSGHGVRAAMLVGGLLKALRLIRAVESDPRTVLTRLNDDLHADILPGSFATCCAIVLEPETGAGEIILAGHHRALIRSGAGTVVPVGTSGLALGVMNGEEFRASLQTGPIALDPGDRLVLCTDGAFEARNDTGEELGQEGFSDLVSSCDAEPAEAFAKALETGVRARNPRVEDDLAILVVRRLVRWDEDDSAIRTTAVALRRRLGATTDTAAVALRLASETSPLPPIAIPDDLPIRRLGPGGDLILGEHLGGGGGGEVIAAIQRGLDRPVAVKRLAPHRRSAADLTKFISEARVTARLDHPHIVPIHELASDGEGGLLYVMKRLRGRNWLQRLRGLDLVENLEVLLKACDAVAFAHERGIVHRDLKPGNILLGDHGEVLVTDWGLATCVRPGSDLAGVAPAPLDGVAVGSPAYMAPEQARGEAAAIGTATDVYLLGGMLFEMITGLTPHHGTNQRSCIAAAAENRLQDAPPGTDGPLLAIARAALATDPAARPRDAAAFRARLREHLRHRESLILAERARLLLAEAGDYSACIRAIAAYEQSVALWERNAQARLGLSSARVTFAGMALARGDLDLAAAQVDPDDPSHQALAGRIADARNRRLVQEKAADRLRVLEENLKRDSNRIWETIYTYDAAAGLTDWDVISGTAVAGPQGLRLAGGEPRILLLRRPISGDLRLDLVASQPGPVVNDITILFAANRPSGNGIEEATRALNTGYQFKFGAYDNTMSLMIRAGRRMWTQRMSPLAPGRRFRLTIECVDRLVVARCDGKLLCAELDPEPLLGRGHDCIGLVGWRAETVVESFRIERLGRPAVVKIIDLARRHHHRGRWQTAADLYHDVIRSASEESERAEAEAAMSQVKLAARIARRLARLRARLTTVWPGCTVDQLGSSLKVTANGLGLTDLTPLALLPLAALEISRNAVTDLAPIANPALDSLFADDNGITDLRSLRGLPVRTLILDRNQISDLAPLAGMPLNRLELERCPVSDLAPLAGCPLNRLVIDRTNVRDLTSLAGAPLTSLSMRHTLISDLAPLRDSPLGILNLEGCLIQDLSPLVSRPLHSLRLSGEYPLDPALLAKMPLRRLSLTECRWLTDIAPFAELKLVDLELSGSGVCDLSPLAGMPLEELHLAGCPLTSLAPLAGMPLRRLVITGCPDLDRSPVAYLVEIEPGVLVAPGAT